MTSSLLIFLMLLLPTQQVEQLGAWVDKNMGRPYVWGAAGYKSYDCSGLVWRMLSDNGVYLKRTTARKLFLSLKKIPPGETPSYGTLIFFDDLKHVGIVIDSQKFFHAQSSKGTNISQLSQFWKRKVYGYRQLPMPVVSGNFENTSEQPRNTTQ